MVQNNQFTGYSKPQMQNHVRERLWNKWHYV